MPESSMSVYFTVIDGGSTVLARIGDKTKALDKETQQLNQTYKDMLDQDHLNQHHRVGPRAAIVMAIVRLKPFVQPVVVHNFFNFPKQMILRHQCLNVSNYDFFLASFFQFSICSPPCLYYTRRTSLRRVPQRGSLTD